MGGKGNRNRHQNPYERAAHRGDAPLSAANVRQHDAGIRQADQGDCRAGDRWTDFDGQEWGINSLGWPKTINARRRIEHMDIDNKSVATSRATRDLD